MLALWAAPSTPARACGGFFCSRTPIDQTAERIIFGVHGDGTISAYVQIRYNGERDAFAWLLPVPDVPALDVFPALSIQALDLATEPVYAFPECFPLALPEGSAGAGGLHQVAVIRQAVGPFETATLASDSADAILQWLTDNDYRFSDAMVPLIEPYVEAGMKIVAMKLLPDADVSDLQPIVLTYRAEQPMIPLQLTAVAAMPEMSIVTWVLADQRYRADNYENLEIDDEAIRFSQGGNCNYQALVSREVDRFGGRAFVTEYAQPTDDLIARIEAGIVPPDEEAQEAQQALLSLLSGFDYVTRFYTRISAHEMVLDPSFAPSPGAPDLSNEHDLTGIVHDPVCEENACEFLHCGSGSACGVSEGGAASCLCGEGTVARVTQNRFGVPEPFCEPRTSDLSAPDPDAGAPAVDGCEGFSCGERGECLSINGSPACRCDVGYGALVVRRGGEDGVPRSELDCVVATVSEPGAFTTGEPPQPQGPTVIGPPPTPLDDQGGAATLVPSRTSVTARGGVGRGGDGLCSVALRPARAGRWAAGWWLPGLLWLGLRRRGRRHRAR